MPNGEATTTDVRTARARPLTGAILGILIGLALAIVLQQQGVWPLDKILVFLLPAVTGLVGIVITRIGRTAAPAAMTIALIIVIPMGAWGATDLSTTNEVGQLNGGCQVQATTNLDTTTVTDTSKRDPFLVDPQGSLSWVAGSPTAIENHQWEMWVEIANTAVPFDSGGHPNDGKSQGNTGDVSNVTEYAEGRGIPMDQLRGVFMVGGFISGDGGACDGFGFVKIVSEPLETLIAKIAAALALLLLIILLIIAMTGRKRPVAVPVDPAATDGDLTGDAAGGGESADGMDAGSAAAAGALGAAIPGDEDGDGDVDIDDLNANPGAEDLPDKDDLA